MSSGVGAAPLGEVSYPVGSAVDPHCSVEEGCITCGDVAVEMRVTRIDADRGLALCEDEAGGRHTVEIALVQPVSLTDTLLVHAGTAITNLGGTS